MTLKGRTFLYKVSYFVHNFKGSKLEFGSPTDDASNPAGPALTCFPSHNPEAIKLRPDPEVDRLLTLRPESSLLLLIDLQEKLLPAVRDAGAICDKGIKLIAAARSCGIPVRATEHCANRIGPTTEMVRHHLEPQEIYAKQHFGAMYEKSFRTSIEASNRHQIVVLGTEAHVCVMQTALGLREFGYAPHVVLDASASRKVIDRDAAFERLRQAGIPLVTTEMVVFEWAVSGVSPLFRDLLALVK